MDLFYETFKSAKKNKKCIENYDLVYSWFKDRVISTNEWNEFCQACFEELMENNKNILKNLKENA